MKFYRYETWQTGSFDEETYQGWSSDVSLNLRVFEMFKETPKGYWIKHEWDFRPFKWIPKESRKRFAYPTEAEALENFIKRTKRSIEIMEARTHSAKHALSVAILKQNEKLY